MNLEAGTKDEGGSVAIADNGDAERAALTIGKGNDGGGRRTNDGGRVNGEGGGGKGDGGIGNSGGVGVPGKL